MIFYNKIFIHLTFLFSAVLLSFNSVGQTFQFPIKVSENGRYFEDQQGKPFFYSADTGWKLFMNHHFLNSEKSQLLLGKLILKKQETNEQWRSTFKLIVK